MNLKLEDWTSLASLGLAVMFVALLLSFYNFLIGPEGMGPERVVEPGSLLLQLTAPTDQTRSPPLARTTGGRRLLAVVRAGQPIAAMQVSEMVDRIKAAVDSSASKRAVVIGAGPVGLSAAAHLASRGLRPLVLEDGLPDHPREDPEARYASVAAFSCSRRYRLGKFLARQKQAIDAPDD